MILEWFIPLLKDIIWIFFTIVGIIPDPIVFIAFFMELKDGNQSK
jgi:hypothetical protein